MERDDRLLPLPNIRDLQPTGREQDFPTSYSPPYDDAFNDRRSIQEYLHVIYKRLPLILALTILATAVTAFYMYRKPSIYSASTSMIIEPRKQKVQTISLTGVDDYKYYNTQLKLLRNRELMYDVVVQKGLYKDPTLLQNQTKGILTTVKTIFSGDDTPPSKVDTLAVTSGSNLETGAGDKIVLKGEEKERAEMYSASLVGGVTVDEVETTNIVNITVTNTDPKLAAILANGVAEVYIAEDIKRETSKERDLLTSLTNSIEELKESLTSQEQQLVSLMRGADLSVIGENGNELISGRLSTLSGQWLSAMDERRKIEASYKTALQSKDISVLPESMVSTEAIKAANERFNEEKAKLRERLRDLDQKIGEAEAERKELLVRYTPEYVEVRRMNAKIAQLKESRAEAERDGSKIIAEESNKSDSKARTGVLSGLQAQLSAASSREGKLREEYLREVSKANVQGQAERQLTTLKREIETKRGLLDNYTQKQKEQELAISSSVPDNIKISSYAVTPGGPIGPERNRNIVLAFLVSLLGGVGLSFLLDYLDDSIRTSDDIGRHLGLPTLALIPHQEVVANKNQLKSGSADGDEVHSLALIALQDTRSPIAEAYRHLRTSLLFSSAGNPPQTILVTSSQPSEGKTTTAINTAIALAQSDAKVVIIDCDLRRPRLHSHFGLSNTHGLTNYLSGEKDTQNLLKQCPDLPNLKIISSGPIPPNPAELLSSNEMKNLLQYLKGNFKHVIIDSPPAISFTDSAILSTLVDGVVLVAKAGSSSIHLMRRFKQRLAGLGTRIYGVVLNGVKPNSLEYGYYGYDYSFDYYSNSDETTPLLEDESEHSPDEEYVDSEPGSIHDTNE